MEELNVSDRIIYGCFPVNSPTKLIANIFLRVYAYVSEAANLACSWKKEKNNRYDLDWVKS